MMVAGLETGRTLACDRSPKKTPAFVGTTGLAVPGRWKFDTPKSARNARFIRVYYVANCCCQLLLPMTVANYIRGRQ